MRERFKPQQLKWLILILAFTSLSANAETYLCVADKATGFVKEGNEWSESHFREDRKFTLKKESYGVWRWTQIGRKGGLTCPVKKDDKGNDFPIVGCQLATFEYLIFNKMSLQFIFSTPGGYAIPAYGDDTTVMAVGKCSPL